MKFQDGALALCEQMSHPSRGAWIEIMASSLRCATWPLVAPLAGCVD